MVSETRNTADEKVLQRLRKLYALATQGVAGEKENAERLLHELLEKYGLTIDAVDENKKERHQFYVPKKYHMLVCNIFVNYFGGNERFETDLHIYDDLYNKNRIIVKVDCTPWEFVEYKELVDWHIQNFAREWRKVRKNFCSAYIEKHNLYATNRNEWFNEKMANRKERPLDFQTAMLQSALAMGMDNVSHRKAIEAGNENK